MGSDSNPTRVRRPDGAGAVNAAVPDDQIRGLRGRPAELERGQRTSSPHGRGPRTRNTPVRRGLAPRMRWSTRAPVTTCRVPASGGPWPVDALDERRASGTSPSAFSTVNSPPPATRTATTSALNSR